jgi:cold shock protein
LAGPSGRIAFAVGWAHVSDPLQTSIIRASRCNALSLKCVELQRKAILNEHRYRKVLQRPDGGGKDVFVHATALERAGIRSLSEGQKVSFDTQEDRRTGKIAVGNIKVS